MVNQARKAKSGVNGGIVQSLDMLDFSIIHLSAYERLVKRHYSKLKKEEKSYSVVTVVGEAVRQMKKKSARSAEHYKAAKKVRGAISCCFK